MNTKLKVTSILSIAAILAISVLALASLQEVEAKQPKQIGRPDFIANLNWKQTVPLEKGNTAGAIAKFWFTTGDDSKEALRYQFQYNHLNIKETEPGEGDKVEYPGAVDTITKIHIHENPPGVKGFHAFNIMAPWDDQDDIEFDTSQRSRSISGIWEDSDENNPGTNDGTKKLSVKRDSLCAGNLYLNVHTENHGPGGLRGQILPVSDAC